MWLLPSLGRPERLNTMIKSYDWSDKDPVVLLLWECDPRLREYGNVPLPPSWHSAVLSGYTVIERQNQAFAMWPDEPFYGGLSDDITLSTPGMLKELVKEAGSWHIAYPNDGWHREKLVGFPAIGGDFIRALGFVAEPSFKHNCVDNAMTRMGKDLGLLRYRKDLRLQHWHAIYGKGPWDNTYEIGRALSEGASDIYAAWERRWRATEYERVKALLPQEVEHG